MHLKFKISIKEFKNLLHLRKTYNANPDDIKIKFSSTIANYLSVFIQQVGQVCFLTHQTNHFKAGTRKDGPFWQGKFNCNFKDIEHNVTCASFLFKILDLDESQDKYVNFECYIIGKLIFCEIFVRL